MTFQTTVPLSTERPSASVARFQSNWTKADADYAIDHVSWTATTNNGRHKKVQFDTNNATAAQIGTNSEIYTLGAVPVPYFRNSAGAGHFAVLAAQIRFDTAGIVVAGSAINATSVRNFAGIYTVTITNVPVLPFLPFVQIMNTGFASVANLTANTFQIFTYTTNGLSTDRECSVMVLAVRAP